MLYSRYAVAEKTGKIGGGGGSFRRFALALLLASVLPSLAIAGQTVIIDGDVGHAVYGNGDLPDGGVPIHDDWRDPNGNKVIVNGGTVAGYVYGGYATTGIDGSATATGNSVFINGGTVDNTYGGYASSSNGSATSTGNSVFINGGTMRGSVYGGIAASPNASATHNTVTISGSPVLTNAGFAGGSGSGGITKDFFTGNTLNVWNYTGTAVGIVMNFQNYNFVLPASLQALEVTVTANLNDQGGRNDQNGRGSTVTGVSTIGGAAPLQPGTEVTLISAGTLNATDFTQTKAQGKHGATLLYDWGLNAANNKLAATLDSVQAHPQAKALSEGFLGGLALATQGADLAAGQGMANAVGAAGGGFGTFGALSGASLRQNTGSHVDMNSLSLIAGLARGTDTGYGRLTGGVFAEFGTGSYDTFNSFGNASANGDGDAYHVGGGILGRMDFAAAGCGKWYAEASARLGAMQNDYGSSDLRDGMGRGAGYDSSSLYYGLHVGTGYILSIGEKASLDFSAKYFWTRQGSDDVTLATGDPVRFDDADSHRLRLGGRYAYALNDRVSPYAGAAYEYEFDGKAKASTYGYAIDAPSLRGGTGMAELGIRYSRGGDRGVSVDVGVQGYIGKREGVTGSLQLGWAF